MLCEACDGSRRGLDRVDQQAAVQLMAKPVLGVGLVGLFNFCDVCVAEVKGE